MAKKKIHPLIKERLGYDSEISDKDFLKSWKKRSTQVCKPCWELKYCPYGPFVEQSPLIPVLRSDAVKHNDYIKKVLETNLIGGKDEVSDGRREYLTEILRLAELDFYGFVRYVAPDYYREIYVRQAGEDGKDIFEALSGPLPNIEKYSVPFPLSEGDEEDEEELSQPLEFPPELVAYAEEEKRKIRDALETGFEDNRRPLDRARRLAFEREVGRFDANNYPESIPESVSDMQCNIFGHICPVVFVGESVTETAEARRRGRYVSFQTKMRVVRRDNYTCQECGKHLRDNEVEFDHIIPFSKGGSSEEHNIRLTCFDCNREKSDEILL